MKVTINTEQDIVEVNGVIVYQRNTTTGRNPAIIADRFAEHRGDKEYTGVVKTIQEWYYGRLLETAWCATAMSYFADQAGYLVAIGGKNENVYNMLQACKNSGCGVVYEKENIPSTILKGDILFWLWCGDTMTSGSSKHVNIAEYDSENGGKIFAIGGNQKDKICTLEYTRDNLYAVYRMR